jgi:ABC-type Mn2+/Zn2+ transport system permease subunit
LTGYAAGLLVSTALDLPAGPVIVWTLAILAVAWAFFTGVRRSGADSRGA